MSRRPGYRPRQLRSTEASRQLVVAHRRARFQMQELASALGVSPRTLRRWEIGETHPSKKQWAKVVACLATYVPAEAVELARLAGVPSPIAPPAPVDTRAIEEAIVRAADLLDVSPRRVRAAVDALARATAGAGGTLADLAKACAPEARVTPDPA